MFHIKFVGGSSDGYEQTSYSLPDFWHGPSFGTDEWYKMDYRFDYGRLEATYRPCQREEAERYFLLAGIMNMDYEKIKIYLDGGLQAWIEAGPSKSKPEDMRV